MDAIFYLVEGGFAVEVGERNVVVALQSWDMSSGSNMSYLLLLDRRGHLLDRLSCGIDSRLTHIFLLKEEDLGVFRTDMPHPPEPDGALLVISYIPGKDGHAARRGHVINRGDSTYYFQWKEGAIRYEEWMKKGLCRVTVRDGKFVTLFPLLSQ